jgi:hypothetical protein
MRKLLVLFLSLLSFVVLAKSLENILPRGFKPDITLGQTLYASSCSQCHTTTAFSTSTWKTTLTPAVMVYNLSESPTHALNLGLQDLWHIAAYTWTQSATPQQIKFGESLAFTAQERMKQDAFWLMLTRGQDLVNLQSRDWVLSHTAADIDTLVHNLSGDLYPTLSETDKRALIDYIYASYFVWPETWNTTQ